MIDTGTAHRIATTDPDYFIGRANGLLAVHSDGSREVARQIAQFHPGYEGKTDAEILQAELMLDDALLIVAREHGFEDWPLMQHHIAAVATGETIEPFLLAFEAIKAGDTQALQELLQGDPSLVNASGTNGNTLLNLAAGCDKTEAAKILVDAGADPNIGNRYGLTPLHEAGYKNQLELAQLFVAAGASLHASARGDGGTPLVQALFWGHREVGDWLAEQGIYPLNLRAAAGAGRLDLVQQFFDGNCQLKPEAGAHREFYRPHPGFPAWTPTDAPQEILDEALVYAAKRGNVEVMEFLLGRGAQIDGEPYNGSALQWAVRNGHLETATWLLDRGAQIDRLGSFGGERNITPLHTAAWGNQPDAVRLLLKRGADARICDARYNSTAAGWAAHLKCEAALAVFEELETAGTESA